MENHKHKLLKQVALRWVRSVGCICFACEVRWYFCGIPDVVGIKANGDVYIVEAKDSHADLATDFYLTFTPKGRKRTKGMKLESSRDVDFVYYILSDWVDSRVLPEWIGIIDEHGRVQRRAKRREISRTRQNKAKNFDVMARKLSWLHYGWVIRGEQEQKEFSLL